MVSLKVLPLSDKNFYGRPRRAEKRFILRMNAEVVRSGTISRSDNTACIETDPNFTTSCGTDRLDVQRPSKINSGICERRVLLNPKL